MVRVQHLFAHWLRVALLCYYLDINQILIRGSPEKKFAQCSQSEGLAQGRHFSNNRRKVQMRISELFVKKKTTKFYGVSAWKKGWNSADKGGGGSIFGNFMQAYFIDGP